jgi:hypothetical protein
MRNEALQFDTREMGTREGGLFRATRRHIPEDRILHSQSRENLNSYIWEGLFSSTAFGKGFAFLWVLSNSYENDDFIRVLCDNSNYICYTWHYPCTNPLRAMN